MDIKSNPRTLRNAIQWDPQTAPALPFVDTGVDGCNNPFQDAERVRRPPEVSTASTAKGETERGTESERDGSSLRNKWTLTLGWIQLDLGTAYTASSWPIVVYAAHKGTKSYTVC